jgi:hypothetical protein
VNKFLFLKSQNGEHNVNIPQRERLLHLQTKRQKNAVPNVSNRVEHYFGDNNTTNDTLSLSAETSDHIDENVTIIKQIFILFLNELF